MDFKDILGKYPFDLEKIMVMRHRPMEPTLRKVLPWLAVERPDVFNAYQQCQNPDAEKALMKADVVASFIGQGDQAIFVGLYRRGDWRAVTESEFWAIPAVQVLKPYRINGITGREFAQWFELELLEACADWKGRLVVKWPAGRLWWRWAKSNEFTIQAIHLESVFADAMPSWDQLRLTWAELKVLPSKWRDELRRWRAVYFIIDITDGKGYVGSAFGNENLLQRWENYANTGHGGNIKLKKRNPENFVFTILQRPSPDMDKADVERLEASWKTRLSTREYGLNDN